MHALGRIWHRAIATINREPVPWVLVSLAMVGFGLLFLLAGSVDVIAGALDQARGVHGTAVVRSCNDLRVAHCQVTILDPLADGRTVSVEPGSPLETGARVPIVILPGGQVEVVGAARWWWDIAAIVAGVALAALGGWRLLRRSGHGNE